MQPLKVKLSDVRTFAAIFSTHKGKDEEASFGAVAFLPMFLQSYHTRQTAALTITSTRRFRSRSTTCVPSFSIARILWYVLLLEIIISLSTLCVFTIMIASGKHDMLAQIWVESISNGIHGTGRWIVQGLIISAASRDPELYSSTGMKFSSLSNFW